MNRNYVYVGLIFLLFMLLGLFIFWQYILIGKTYDREAYFAPAMMFIVGTIANVILLLEVN